MSLTKCGSPPWGRIPPSPPDRIHNCPFSKWRGVFTYFSIKAIVFYFLMKVDGDWCKYSIRSRLKAVLYKVSK